MSLSRIRHHPAELASDSFLGTLSFRKALSRMPTAPWEEALPPGGQHCPTRGNRAHPAPAWAVWFLRGPWLAKSGKRARFFPLLQLAAFVEKVNTPHSLTSKSSSQEWEVIKSLFQPSPGEPTRAGLCHWGPTGTPTQCQNWSTPAFRSLPFSPCRLSPVAGPHPLVFGTLWKIRREER